MSSRFVDPNELRQIDIGDGDWVKVPVRFSYGFIEQFQEAQGSDTEKAAQFLEQMIKKWNLKLPSGEVAPIDVDHIRTLEVATFMLIMENVTKGLDIPKEEKPQ